MIVVLIEFLIATLLVTLVAITFNKRDIKMNILFFASIFCATIIAIFLTIFFENPNMMMYDTIEIDVKSGKILVTPKTEYFFRDITNEVSTNGKVDYNTVGEYELEYEVPILFDRNYKKKQKVKIVDKIAPEITLNGEDEIKVLNIEEYQELGATAKDNYDGDITNLITIEKQQVSGVEIDIKYTVSDKSGNKTSKIRKIILIDTVAPVITLNGEEKVKLIVGDKYEEQGANAIDDKEGDITGRIQVIGEVDTTKAGNYIVDYKASDLSGNETTKRRIVIVTSQAVPEETNTISKKGVIYLTFDDGPNMGTTPKILDILQAKGIKATFFILNYDETEGELVKREIAEGHTVAIHGYSHEYKYIYQSLDTYMENITKLQTKIKETTGYNAIITRFPGGSSNTISSFNPGIMSLLSKEVLIRGYKYFDWNVDSDDAGSARNSKDVYRNVVRGLSKSRSNVVLMHDFSGNYKTVDALADIIDYGLENGYTFEAITEETPMVTHRVFN